ncbi:class I SAM-dependent methyltransferase [Candidatus Magnetominusculus xianensis]|nr:class I SAM-dependent methyltransferase [Candidatus Magnetominusculus xianensis]
MKVFLHVGCGASRQDQTTRGFNTPEWRELRLDIDKSGAPDIIGSMTDMPAVADQSVDAIFSSHNVEHLAPHEVPLALAEFRRVLKPDGFAVITCPDLQAICALVAQDTLHEPIYSTVKKPITALDVLYGFRVAMAEGGSFMAHRCGFTQSVMVHTLRQAGFAMAATKRRGEPMYDLWALAAMRPFSGDEMQSLVSVHFPIQGEANLWSWPAA